MEFWPDERVQDGEHWPHLTSPNGGSGDRAINNALEEAQKESQRGRPSETEGARRQGGGGPLGLRTTAQASCQGE